MNFRASPGADFETEFPAHQRHPFAHQMQPQAGALPGRHHVKADSIVPVVDLS